MDADTPYDLSRFLDAQTENYATALAELKMGKKLSHWIWYVFPQVAGLGFSPVSQLYAINSRDEALAYLKHEVLGHRLKECATALLSHQGVCIDEIMGFPDNLKLKSSMTLFSAIEPDGVFAEVLEKFFAGERDERTLGFLNL